MVVPQTHPATPIRSRPPAAARMVPNFLTVVRLGIAAAFPFAPGAWRAPLLVLGAGTDFLDGWIARRFGLTSWVGALLDGIADKAFTITVLATFAFEGRLSWWALALVMTRDLAVAGIAAYLAWCRAWPEFTRMAARQPGKVTTVFVYLLMLVLLLAPAHAGWVLWPAILCSILAAVDYLLLFLSVEPERG